MNNLTDFMTVDLSVSQEHPAKTLVVEVTIDPSEILPDYAKGYVEEMYRLNYDKAKQVSLTADELTRYFTFLIAKRVQCVYNVCSDFRQLKQLYIPAWIQGVLSQIGVAVDREQGIRFEPQILEVDDPKLATNELFDEMLAISDKLSAFENDLAMVRDAMPRDVSGDLSFMATALIGDYVASCRKVEHPITTYVTTFLGMKLKEEATISTLYRRQYGDRNLIAQVILHDKAFRR